MATMTYRMDAQKHLICTTNATIYQNECGVDAISFLLPLKYDELDIGECVVAIEYVDPMSVTHVEVLEKDAEIYRDQYYRYTFGIDSDFTKVGGKINFVIEIVKGEGDGKQVLRISSGIVTIEKWEDYMQYLPDDNLSPMDKRVKIIEDLSNG